MCAKMQIYPIHPYIIDHFIRPKRMSSIFNKLGVGNVPVAIPVNLSPEEAMIQNHIGEMMQILERHLAYWKNTQSNITLNALCTTEAVMTSLLTALYKPENRLQSIIVALYNQDLRFLIKSIRSPAARRNSSPSAELIRFRETVIQDRNTFKLNFRRIIQSLKALCQPELDQRVTNLSPASLNQFFEDKLKQEQEVDPNVDVDTEEVGIVLKEEQNPLVM